LEEDMEEVDMEAGVLEPTQEVEGLAVVAQAFMEEVVA
jgi:hypothetical protein